MVRKAANSMTFNKEGHQAIRGERYAPYPSNIQVSERASVGGIHGEGFEDLYLQDFVLAGRARADWIVEDTQLGTYQRALIERGLRSGSDEDEDVPLNVGVSMTYAATVGLELFKEVELLEDKDRVKDKKVPWIHF